jgi:hypothetical protein
MKRIYADNESLYRDVGLSGESVKERFRLSLNLVFRKYLLNTPVRMAHFFGQTAQESYFFMVTREVAITASRAIKENHISIQSEEAGYLQITPDNRKQLMFFAERGQKGYYEGRTDLGNKDIRTLAERGWTINEEDIEYFSPHDRGYVMSCFTAFKGHEKTSVTVAQCLDYGELQSFKQLLGKVRIAQ